PLWAPRQYFAPPYDSEDGLTKVSAEWLGREMGLTKLKYVNSHANNLFMMLSQAAQAVGDGLCETLLVLYPTGNVAGGYLPEATETARDGSQWTDPWLWGWRGAPVAYAFEQYCKKYGTSHDRMAPFVVNLRRNGLLVPWGYYAQHEPMQLTEDDYLDARWLC